LALTGRLPRARQCFVPQKAVFPPFGNSCRRQTFSGFASFCLTRPLARPPPSVQPFIRLLLFSSLSYSSSQFFPKASILSFAGTFGLPGFSFFPFFCSVSREGLGALLSFFVRSQVSGDLFSLLALSRPPPVPRSLFGPHGLVHAPDPIGPWTSEDVVINARIGAPASSITFFLFRSFRCVA